LSHPNQMPVPVDVPFAGRRPALVALSPGAGEAGDPEFVARLLDGVRRQLPGVHVLTASVGRVAPTLSEVMSAMDRPAVVIPLLLSTGRHLTVDVRAAVALCAAPVHVAAPLGPDRHIARAMTARLREAGALFGDAVVLAAAGSRDPARLADVERAAALLRSEWGPRVSFAYLSRVGPDVPSAVRLVRQTGASRVCVAPYFLAPGQSSRRVRDLASVVGATTVAPVLAGHRLVRDLVVLRYQQGVKALAAVPCLVA